MFERLIVTESRGKGRASYFLSTFVVAVCGLILAVVVSLYAVEISLGTGDLEMTTLIAPVEVAPPEPEQAPAPRPEQRTQAAPDVPTRQANIARLDESPPEVPTQVSTVPNSQKERPSSRYFEIGKIDADPVGDASVGRTTDASSGGSGLGGTGTDTVAKGEEEAAPPPPPVKEVPPAPKRPTSLGIINGKALSLPIPVYSPAARAINAQGQVRVQVMLDEKGSVVSANAVSGHPLLQSAAENAARRARFTPTLLSGEAVKVTGVIIYNFHG